MRAHSLLATLFGFLMAMIVTAGGCATGSNTTGNEEGGVGPGEGGPTDSPSGACMAGQIKCGSKCIDPKTDNANCGKCDKACEKGHVCSGGKCGLSCTGVETMCSGAPFDAGPVDSGGMSDGPGPGEGGMGEAGPGEGGAADASSMDASGKDAGKHDAGKSPPPVPYCANLTNDPKNCGACGKECAAEETCEGSVCVPHCKKGQTVCPGNTGCKGPGECCTDMDCSNVGEHCPSPGGTCTCPPKQHVCAAFSTCIPDTSCCTTSDCKVTGETCPAPGGVCACPSGQVACSMTNSCIPMGACCMDSDCPVTGEVCTAGVCGCPMGGSVCSGTCIAAGACCPVDCMPPPPHVMTTSCVSATCTIATCDAGYVDVDGTYTDGCECKDDSWGKSCSAVSNIGSINIGGTPIVETGVLPLSGEQNWFEVDFAQYTLVGFAGSIAISPSSEFLFNVYDADCTATPTTCLTEGTTSLNLATWTMSQTDTTTVTPPPVGTAGVVYIEVFRNPGSPTLTCDAYTLTVSD